MIRRFRISNYFHEMFKFRDLMNDNIFRKNHLRFHKVAKFFKYLKRMLISDKFCFQQYIIRLCYFNRSRTDSFVCVCVCVCGGGGGGEGEWRSAPCTSTVLYSAKVCMEKSKSARLLFLDLTVFSFPTLQIFFNFYSSETKLDKLYTVNVI